jgi:ABC-2 type transport system permease protein
MRAFRTLLAHELRSAWLGWTTWAAWALFLGLQAVILWYAILACARGPMPWTPVEAVFRWFPLPLLCILPLLTMRTLAEERRSGTLGALLSTQAGPGAVVLAKFASVWLTWMVFWASFALLPPIAAATLGASADPRLADPLAIGGGLAFVAVSGLLHAAIGILCGSRTRSPALAALLTFVCLLGLTVSGGLLASLPADGWESAAWLRDAAVHLRNLAHLDDFAAGVVDTAPLALYLGGAAICLGVACRNVEEPD